MWAHKLNTFFFIAQKCVFYKLTSVKCYIKAMFGVVKLKRGELVLINSLWLILTHTMGKVCQLILKQEMRLIKIIW